MKAGVDYKIVRQRNRAAGARGQSARAAAGDGRAGPAQDRTHRLRDLRQNQFRHHRFRRACQLSARARRRIGTLHHGHRGSAAGARSRDACPRIPYSPTRGSPPKPACWWACGPGRALVAAQRDRDHQSGIERGGRPGARIRFGGRHERQSAEPAAARRPRRTARRSPKRRWNTGKRSSTTWRRKSTTRSSRCWAPTNSAPAYRPTST